MKIIFNVFTPLLAALMFVLTNTAYSVEVIPQVGHPSMVANIAVNPSRNLLASCGQDRTVRIYQLSNLRELRVLKAHTHACEHIAWFDDKTVVSLGFHRDLIVHDIQNGTLLGRIVVGYGILAKDPLKIIKERIFLLKSPSKEISGTTGIEIYSINDRQLQRVSEIAMEEGLKALTKISAVNEVNGQLTAYDESLHFKKSFGLFGSEASLEQLPHPIGKSVGLLGVSSDEKYGVFLIDGQIVVNELNEFHTRIETSCKDSYGGGRIVKFNKDNSRFGCIDGKSLLIYSTITKRLENSYRLSGDESISSYSWLGDGIILGGYQGTIEITQSELMLPGAVHGSGTVIPEFSRNSKSLYLLPHVDSPSGPERPLRFDLETLQISYAKIPAVEHGLFSLAENESLFVADKESVQLFDFLGHQLASASIKADLLGETFQRRMTRIGKEIFIAGSGVLLKIDTSNLADQEYRSIDLCGRPRFLNSYDQNTILFGGDNVCFLDIRSNQSVVKKLTKEGISVTEAKRIPNSPLIATATYGGTLAFLDLNEVASRVSGFALYKDGTGGGAARIEALAVSPNGHMVATGSLTSEVKVSSSEAGFNASPTTLRNKTMVGHNTWVYGLSYSLDGRYLASSSPDGSLILWSASTNEILATVVFRKKKSHVESIVVTPEGFFSASSLEAADMATLRDGRNASGAAKYWDVFHRPDIVRAKLLGDEDYFKRASQELTIQKALKKPPPSIGSFAGPKAEVNDLRIRIPYTIRSEGGGVGEVLVLHNGKLVKSDGIYKDALGAATLSLNTSKATSSDEVKKGVRKILGHGEEKSDDGASNRNNVVVRQAKPKTLNAALEFSDSVEIDVIPGEENEITVLARNEDNTILGQGKTVRFKSTLPKADPHLWILSVGIASFQDIGVPKLVSPKKDALDFACSYGGKEALKSADISCDKLGYASSLFKSTNIHVIEPLTNEKATRANILAKLDEIAAKAKPTDTFIWFVSSHGTMDANSVYGIVPFDAKCQGAKCDAASGLISSNDILEKSKAIKAMKQLLILDTCNAGGLDNKMSGLYDARMSGLAKNMGLHLYAAATATESALDGQDASKNSIFTATLLDGLAGAAGKNADGQISIVPLGQYVKSNTAEASRKAYPQGTPQTPVIQHFGKDSPLVGGTSRQ